jgi:hypothetical protein
MCTPSLAIDAIIEIHHVNEKPSIKSRGLSIEEDPNDHESLVPSTHRRLESDMETTDVDGNEEDRYQNNNKKDHKRRNRNHKQVLRDVYVFIYIYVYNRILGIP